VPGFSAFTTAKPRGSQVLSNVVAIFGLVFLVAKFGWNVRKLTRLDSEWPRAGGHHAGVAER
jgi:hypothetical protein